MKKGTKNTLIGVLVVSVLVILLLLCWALSGFRFDFFLDILFSGDTCEFCCYGPVVLVLAIIAYVTKKVLDISRGKLKTYAERNGYTYVGNVLGEVEPIVWGTPLDKGKQKSAEDGVKIPYKNFMLTFCLYSHLVKRKKQAKRLYYTVLYTPINLSTPGSIYMRKESYSDKLAAAMGKNDLDFEHKEFSDYYYVRAKPEKLGYQFFHPRMMELFLQRRDFNLIVRNGYIVLYKPFAKSFFTNVKYIIKKDTPLVAWLRDTQAIMQRVLKLIPNYLVSSYVVEPVEEEEEVVVAAIAEEEGGGGGGMMSIECPECGHGFDIAQGQKSIKCPSCGLEGVL